MISENKINIMREFNFLKKIGDTDYIEVGDGDATYGIQDISDKYRSTIEETNILTKEVKLKEFRKFIPSYDAFKNLIKEKNGLIKIEGMFQVVMLDITKSIMKCYYLERIIVDPNTRTQVLVV
jgi:hypothetical protein